MSGASTSAVGRPYRRPENWMLDRLPPWMLDDDLFRRFASVFQVLATSWLEHADQLEHVFDPDLAPPSMVQQLAGWIGVEGVDPWLPEQRQRALTREVGALSRLQGTARRLVRVLELVTDASVVVRDTGGVVASGDPLPPPGVLRIELGSVGDLDIAAVVAFVRAEVPATTVFELVVDGEHRWPRPATRDDPAVDAVAGPVICPTCGSTCPPPSGAMAAGEFCATCDYPIFWAVPNGAPVAPITRSRQQRAEPVLPLVPPPARPDAATAACPGCRLVVALPNIDPPDAACFCSYCDFPLFWIEPSPTG